MRRAEKQQAESTMLEIDAWLQLAEDARHLAAHPPFSEPALHPNASALLSALEQVQSSTDRTNATPVLTAGFFTSRRILDPAREAMHRLLQFHAWMKEGAHDRALHRFHQQVLAQNEAETSQLKRAISELHETSLMLESIKVDVSHMPITRRGFLKPSDIELMSSIDEPWSAIGPSMQNRPAGTNCASETCAEDHKLARFIIGLHEVSTSNGARAGIVDISRRSKEAFKSESRMLQNFMLDAETWQSRIEQIWRSRKEARDSIRSKVEELQRAGADLALDQSEFRLIPLDDKAGTIASSLALLRDRHIGPDDSVRLKQLERTSEAVISEPASIWAGPATCHRDLRCLPAHDRLAKHYTDSVNHVQDLDRLTITRPTAPRGYSSNALRNPSNLLDPSLHFEEFLSPKPISLELIPTSSIRDFHKYSDSILERDTAIMNASRAAKLAGQKVREIDIDKTLTTMDLDTLRQASQAPIRTAPLEAHGISNLREAHRAVQRKQLASIPGLGAASAHSIEQAVLRIYDVVRDETPVRIDIRARLKETRVLLDALRAWDAMQRFEPTTSEVALARAMRTVLRYSISTNQVLALATASSVECPPLLSGAFDETLVRFVSATPEGDVWTDFLGRPAEYFGLLQELGFTTEDEKKMHGDLPDEIVTAVRDMELDRAHLTASLRTYQSFGARFSLVQKKVIIGDEMGLGKTVEALAVLTHLHSRGSRHFVVVCPAAVVSNWTRETTRHTKLRASRIHGRQEDRQHAISSWLARGGVAITTYDLFPRLLDLLDKVDVACVVFDEAHYIKNPRAKRSMTARRAIESTEHAILMTGTPLENKVEEFRNLIGYIRPDLADTAPEFLASKFRAHVAPAYLRRNQEDVLTELPDLVEVEEWMGMSTDEKTEYKDAVRRSDFMLMRRVGMLSPGSLKIERLLEIASEASENQRKVIVFSYFRDVLGHVSTVLRDQKAGPVFGPLTGSMPAAERQALIDRFTDARDGAVLVSQIAAGGVGLNIQSASVVVICEPQLKPTTESQAIARAHRMGQTKTVQVHRLLTEDSVDERLVEILATKRALFEDFAHHSEIAQRAPDAVDMTDSEITRNVVAMERERLLGGRAAS